MYKTNILGIIFQTAFIFVALCFFNWFKLQQRIISLRSSYGNL